jgi:type II secretory pathway component PulM
MSGHPNNFSEKLFASIKQGLKQAKDVLSKDYSLQDLKNLKSLPKTLQQKLSGLKLASSNTANAAPGSTQASEKFDYKQIPNLLLNYITGHRNVAIGLVVLIVVLLINAFVISPYAQRVQNQLDMRPAQWSQLQSLIKQAKSTSAAPATVSLLDDTELQKIRSVLTSRGIKPNVLRLTADNPPRIELQASDAMFSVLLDTLDELRTTWRLYPQQLNVVSASGAGGAGVVNIGGVLVQYGGQSGAQLSGVSR